MINNDDKNWSEFEGDDWLDDGVTEGDDIIIISSSTVSPTNTTIHNNTNTASNINSNNSG